MTKTRYTFNLMIAKLVKGLCNIWFVDVARGMA